MCLSYSGEVIHYWRFHFWRISSQWYRISLSFYPNEILDYVFCQQDKLGIWPGCSCNQEYLLQGCVKIVLFLSNNHSPPRALRWGHEVWETTLCFFNPHFWKFTLQHNLINVKIVHKLPITEMYAERWKLNSAHVMIRVCWCCFKKVFRRIILGKHHFGLQKGSIYTDSLWGHKESETT